MKNTFITCFLLWLFHKDIIYKSKVCDGHDSKKIGIILSYYYCYVENYYWESWAKNKGERVCSVLVVWLQSARNRLDLVPMKQLNEDLHLFVFSQFVIVFYITDITIQKKKKQTGLKIFFKDSQM